MAIKQKSLFIMVVLACVISAAWFGLTILILPPNQYPLAGILSLLFLAGFVAFSGVYISRALYRPMRRTRELVQALSESGFRERLYIEDIESEPGRIQLELNSLMDRLEDNMARQRRFVGAVSHDIRTPLTIMKGDIEVAIQRRRSAPEYIEVLESNLEEIERIQRLVDDLVTLARADYGELGLNLKTVSLGSLLAEVREQFADASRKKGLLLDSYIEADVQIQGDPARLRQLMHNLMDNAIHYTPSGGRVELALLTDREREQVQIRVRDTGVGMSQQDIPHIFEPFYRGKTSRRARHDGYGLGLAICDHVIRAHQGRISVESRQGQGSGTTFTVHIPVRPRPA